MASLHRSQPLRSFWIGGYEGADHVNAAGEALDMARATSHQQRLEEDYRRAARLGVLTVRESIGWRLCEGTAGQLDLSRVLRIARAARHTGVQPLWTLMHYGIPSDLSLLDDALVERFAHFCTQVARTLLPLCPEPRFYTPINEISFLAWAASVGELSGPAGPGAAGGAPDGASTEHSGYQIKRRLVRAALAGMAAIRGVDPGARFLHVEPLVHVAAPPDRPDLAALARRIRDYQWQTLDLLCGRMEPELGGHEAALDWLGLNHYHSSQWEALSEDRLSWHLRDPRRQPLSSLLLEVWDRYRRPMLIAETGHVGMGRAAWLHEIAGEALQARALGLPLRGICLYPLLDRPDWQDASRWHRCGLWQVEEAQPAQAQAHPGSRHLVQPYARALRAWQGLPAPPAPRSRRLLVLLPVRWEALDAGLQLLLRRLSGEGRRCPALRQLAARSGGFSVLLVEPPSRQAGGAHLRRYRLGPALELLLLHGLGPDGGWARAAEALPLLRAALGPGPAGGTLTWLMRWPWERLEALHRVQALPGDALALQPDAGALPAGASSLAARADLLLCEAPGLLARCSAWHRRVLRLPTGLPPLELRPPPPGSYEAGEVQRLLGHQAAVRMLVLARPQGRAGISCDARWLAALALLRPHWHFFMLGCDRPAIAPGQRWPDNCHWMGELAAELLPGLLRSCDAGLILAPPGAANEHHWPELLEPGLRSGLPLVSTPLGELGDPRPGLCIAEDPPAMVLQLEACLRQGRLRPDPRGLPDFRRGELALAQAFVDLLDAKQTPAPPAEPRLASLHALKDAPERPRFP